MSVFGVILVRFSLIRTLRIYPYSVRMRENVDQNNSECEQFLRSECLPLARKVLETP